MNLLKRLLTISLFLTASVQAQESRTYFVSDVVGSPIMATDEYANLRWSEEYLPFGERTKYSVNTANNGRWFTSAPQNIDSGLVDLGNRMYDPVVGRFYGIDPVGSSASRPFTINRYAYANNNPYKFVDPDGLDPYLAQLINAARLPANSDLGILGRDPFPGLDFGDPAVIARGNVNQMLGNLASVKDKFADAANLTVVVSVVLITGVAGTLELGVGALIGAGNSLEATSGSFAFQSNAVNAMTAANLAAGIASPLVETVAIVGLELQMQRMAVVTAARKGVELIVRQPVITRIVGK